MGVCILQQGQWLLACSHGSKQWAWNLWPHPNCIRVSESESESEPAFIIPSKHTTHSSSSLLHLIFNHETFFFHPLFCTFSSSLPLPLALLQLLSDDLHCAWSLSSNLFLASLTSAPSLLSSHTVCLLCLWCINVELQRWKSWLLTYKHKDDRRVPEAEAEAAGDGSEPYH